MISYEPFWETLHRSRETTYSLIRAHQISSSTIARLRRGLPLTTRTLDALCGALGCQISDLIEYRPPGPLP